MAKVNWQKLNHEGANPWEEIIPGIGKTHSHWTAWTRYRDSWANPMKPVHFNDLDRFARHLIDQQYASVRNIVSTVHQKLLATAPEYLHIHNLSLLYEQLCRRMTIWEKESGLRPQQAELIREQIWHNLAAGGLRFEFSLLLLLVLAGQRASSIAALKSHHLDWGAKSLCVTIPAHADKNRFAHMVSIGCGCFTTSNGTLVQNYCIPCCHKQMISSAVESGDFAIDRIDTITSNLGLGRHSARCTLACAIRKAVKSTDELRLVELNQHFGWSERSTEFEHYSNRHRLVKLPFNIKLSLPHIFR